MIYLFGPTHGARSQHLIFGNFLSKKGIDHRKISKYEDLLDLKIGDRDMFLCGIPVDCYERNIETIRFLRNKNAQIFFLLDHWHNSYKNFYDVDSGEFFLPDRIFCIDSFMKKSLRISGIDSEKLTISGHPALEGTFNRKIGKNRCKEIKKAHNISGKVFTLYLDPIPVSRKIEVGYCDTEIVDLVCRVFSNFKEDHTLIVKCHPRTDISSIRDTVSKFGRDKILMSYNLKNIDDNQVLNISDKVVGMTSIMLAHSLVLEKPTKSIQTTPTESGKKRSNYILDMIKIGTEEELYTFFHSENFKKNIIDTCIFKDSCDKIYRTMGI